MASRRDTWLVAQLVAIVLCFSLAPPSHGSENPESPDHVFECGDDQAPSGTYLDLAVGQSLYYDCQAGTLTPIETVSANCLAAPTYDGQGHWTYVPVYGLCLNFDPSYDLLGNVIDDQYTIEVFVAVTGGYGTIAWKDFHDGSLYNDCPDAPCTTGISGFCGYTASLVTYCKDGWSQGIACPSNGSAVKVTGRISATSLVNTLQSSHYSNEWICDD